MNSQNDGDCGCASISIFLWKVETQMLDPIAFYAEWSGHPIAMLQQAVEYFRKAHPDKRLIWLAGDSSLDNKYWVRLSTDVKPWRDPTRNGWHELLPYMLPDVAYHVNAKLMGSIGDQTKPALDGCACVNAAVEESMLRQRLPDKLLPHDKLIRDSISENDVLVVSIGGNDIALLPTPKTMLAVLSLVGKSAWKQLGPDGTGQLTDQQWLSVESSWQFRHLVRLFKTQVEQYLRMLTAKTRPALIVPCMIYYPQVSANTKSWANFSLKCLRYTAKPWILQALIKRLYEKATCQIQVDGARVKPVALFHAMPGAPDSLYVERVEPSLLGGEKCAELIVRALEDELR